jgi:hypothetical protein
MQGEKENLISTGDEMAAVSRLCTEIVKNGDLSSFPVSEDAAGLLQPKENHRFEKMVVEHFSANQTALENYFPFILISGVELVRSPYGACSEHSVYSEASYTSVERDQLIDIYADTSFTTSLWISFSSP